MRWLGILDAIRTFLSQGTTSPQPVAVPLHVTCRRAMPFFSLNDLIHAWGQPQPKPALEGLVRRTD